MSNRTVTVRLTEAQYQVLRDAADFYADVMESAPELLAGVATHEIARDRRIIDRAFAALTEAAPY